MERVAVNLMRFPSGGDGTNSRGFGSVSNTGEEGELGIPQSQGRRFVADVRNCFQLAVVFYECP